MITGGEWGSHFKVSLFDEGAIVALQLLYKGWQDSGDRGCIFSDSGSNLLFPLMVEPLYVTSLFCWL